MIDIKGLEKQAELIAREIRVTESPLTFNLGNNGLIKKEGLGYRIKNSIADDGVILRADLPLVGAVLYHLGKLQARDDNEEDARIIEKVKNK